MDFRQNLFPHVYAEDLPNVLALNAPQVVDARSVLEAELAFRGTNVSANVPGQSTLGRGTDLNTLEPLLPPAASSPEVIFGTTQIRELYETIQAERESIKAVLRAEHEMTKAMFHAGRERTKAVLHIERKRTKDILHAKRERCKDMFNEELERNKVLLNAERDNTKAMFHMEHERIKVLLHLEQERTKDMFHEHQRQFQQQLNRD